MGRKYQILLGILLLALDQVTKAWARTLAVGEKMQVIPHVLWFTHVHNTGSAFSLLQDRNVLLMLVSVVALGVLWHYRKNFSGKWENIIYVLLIVGILGNFIDRVFFGHVTDFIDLGWWPVFNVADSCLVVGVVLLAILELKAKKS